jgi:hypothetical protein
MGCRLDSRLCVGGLLCSRSIVGSWGNWDDNQWHVIVVVISGHEEVG